ncbi:MAG: hypothetical protein IPJ46_07715 [Anaerolineales bacterium]|nr:hypothetical protein [Anaerolineales bacterium]
MATSIFVKGGYDVTTRLTLHSSIEAFPLLSPQTILLSIHIASGRAAAHLMVSWTVSSSGRNFGFRSTALDMLTGKARIFRSVWNPDRHVAPWGYLVLIGNSTDAHLNFASLALTSLRCRALRLMSVRDLVPSH